MKKVLIILGILIIVIVVFLFFSFGIFSISGDSMEPTLKNRDNVLISKIAYFWSQPKRGDIVLVKVENKLWVKRIVGMPKEKIEIKDGQIKINDKVLYESYIKEIHTYGDQRVFLDDNQYYVLGDNREPNQSIDSRIFGPVSRKSILGKVIATFSPKFKILKANLYKLGE